MDSRQNLDVNNSYDFWIKALNCVKKRKKRRSAVRAPLKYMYNKIIISQGE